MNKKLIRLTESELQNIITESVKTVLKEDMMDVKKHSIDNLADILREMAAYVDSNGPEEEYFKEIIQTGLYHDAIGKSVDYTNGVNSYITDY